MKPLNNKWAIAFNYCLINLFIIAYFSFSTVWLCLNAPGRLCPANSLAVLLKAKLEPIVSLVGLEQSWAFFSPDVHTDNIYTLLVITLQNGLFKLVELPRLEKLNIAEKFKQEKYRKLFNDNMPTPGHTFMRADVARFVSRANKEPDNEPMRVAFFLVSNPIAPPDRPSASLSQSASQSASQSTLPSPSTSPSPSHPRSPSPPASPSSSVSTAGVAQANCPKPKVENYFVYGVSPDDL